MDIEVGDVLVGEQVGTESVVGRFGDGFVQSGDVGGGGGEAEGEALVADVGRVALQLLVCDRQVVQRLHCLLPALVLLVLKEAVALGDAALAHQVEELEFPEGFADLAHLVVAEGEGHSSQVDLVVLAGHFQFSAAFEILFLEELACTDYFEGGALDVVELGVGAEEVLHPPRRQRQHCEGFRLLELHVADGQGHGEFWVGGGDDGVEVLEYFL